MAEELHFGRAAERLNLSQPPLSAAIKRLETQVGVKLFGRTSRKVLLTPAGQVYLREVRQILERLSEAAEAARREERGESGQLSVGYKSGSLNTALPQAVRLFRQQHPDVELKLYEMNVFEVQPALLRGDVQVGLLYPARLDLRLSFEVMFSEPLMLALPQGHPLARLDRVPLRLIANEPFVRYQRVVQPECYDAISELCRSAGFWPQVVQEVATGSAAVSLISAGLGVGLVPSSQRQASDGRVEYRFLDGPTVSVDFAAAWHRTDSSVLTAAFVAQMRAAGQAFTKQEQGFAGLLAG
ncbi:LysR family transcriptional regulator YnfL [Deinococcus marmoris]|uniref:LysR family transcriptional regulator YnfL n=1 Tax=Deinococcus marmoris TaxID=249408 RepID=A0A1U7NRC6_9DEIO|nr:LysR family transcriptional regulator YnfL [Deinococcus marmoris]